VVHEVVQADDTGLVHRVTSATAEVDSDPTVVAVMELMTSS
jgi:hypothetical protein